MVFGNMGADSGTGVLFTRNPATGEDVLYGEFLQDAQGEDVVAGIRTPQPIAQLKALNPAVYDELYATVKSLEAGMGDMQDVEFTIMRGTLYILQTRDGKRTGAAAIKIASDMVAAGTASKETAVAKMVNCAHIDQLLHPQIKAKSADYKSLILGKGIPASPGAAVGRIVFTAEDAEAWRERGEAVILVRSETSAEDVAGMHAAEGILTTHGGMTSHAAVVARGWGKPCVCGCGDVAMSAHGKTLTSKLTGEVFHEGDWLSLNASTGEVVKGKLELTPPDVSPLFLQFLRWAAELAPITVHANADSPAEVEQAVSFGAAGIGLCRTEHMFCE
jgi:pyruvate, orthophosphate dikinase